MHTESDQKVTYVRKAVVQLAFKFHIEKFDSAATDLWSEGVASKVVSPRAVWKIHVWRESGGGTSIYLDLVGPMRANKESLEATFHLYIVGESGGPVDSLLSGTKLFQKGGNAALFGNDYWAGVRSISRDRVKKSLQADGSLVVGADVKFQAPDSGGVGEVCLACASRGGETQKVPKVKSTSSSSYSQKASSDYGSTEIEKRSIGKVLNVRNVIAMAEHADTHSLEMLKEACLELIGREWDAVYGSAEWKDLEKNRPRVAVDLAFGAAALTDTHSAEKFKKAFIKLVAGCRMAVYESAAWRELKENKPKLALELAEVVAAVLAEKE